MLYYHISYVHLGFCGIPDVVWERLDGIHGETNYVDHNFKQPRDEGFLPQQEKEQVKVGVNSFGQDLQMLK